MANASNGLELSVNNNPGGCLSRVLASSAPLCAKTWVVRGQIKESGECKCVMWGAECHAGRHVAAALEHELSSEVTTELQQRPSRPEPLLPPKSPSPISPRLIPHLYSAHTPRSPPCRDFSACSIRFRHLVWSGCPATSPSREEQRNDRYTTALWRRWARNSSTLSTGYRTWSSTRLEMIPSICPRLYVRPNRKRECGEGGADFQPLRCMLSRRC